MVHSFPSWCHPWQQTRVDGSLNIQKIIKSVWQIWNLENKTLQVLATAWENKRRSYKYSGQGAFPAQSWTPWEDGAPWEIPWLTGTTIKVKLYLILWQTFLPAGSSVCEEDSEQQSRALRALRRRFISTQSLKPKPRDQISFFVQSVPLYLFSFQSQWEAVSLSLSTLHPSLLSLLWVVLWPRCSQRGRSPWVSSSHFLGKSEPLPSIQPDTELFKDGRTLTHKTRRTHCGGKLQHTNTRPWCSPFSQNPGHDEERLRPSYKSWKSVQRWSRHHSECLFSFSNIWYTMPSLNLVLCLFLESWEKKYWDHFDFQYNSVDFIESWNLIITENPHFE